MDFCISLALVGKLIIIIIIFFCSLIVSDCNSYGRHDFVCFCIFIVWYSLVLSINIINAVMSYFDSVL